MPKLETEASRVFAILGGSPEASVRSTDPQLQRESFANKIHEYLDTHSFSHTLPKKLLDELFEISCVFKRKLLALPKMREQVSSDDWHERSALIKALHKEVLAVRRRVRERIHKRTKRRVKNPEPLTLTAQNWFLRRLNRLREDLEWAEFAQQIWAETVREYDHPPLDSRFLYELKAVVEKRMAQLTKTEASYIVAACAIAAGAVPSPPKSKDVGEFLSMVAMRISRTKSATKKLAEKAPLEVRVEAELDFLKKSLLSDVPPELLKLPMPKEQRRPQPLTGTPKSKGRPKAKKKRRATEKENINLKRSTIFSGNQESQR